MLNVVRLNGVGVNAIIVPDTHISYIDSTLPIVKHMLLERDPSHDNAEDWTFSPIDDSARVNHGGFVQCRVGIVGSSGGDGDYGGSCVEATFDLRVLVLLNFESDLPFSLVLGDDFLSISRATLDRAGMRLVVGAMSVSWNFDLPPGYHLAIRRVDESTHCAWCAHADTKLKLCGKCRRRKYCSVECQKAHWPFHKRQCNSH
ncbi:hypothetical protein Pelo_12873 [Pelomyxa schiedti]|nr:hypothetical protein Pelo_12873 [Pelomyxa schiedti]